MTLESIHSAALASFNRTQTAVREGRVQCRDDRRFYSIPGAQWEGEWEAQFENKPRPEINKVHQAVMRVINEYRNNRISVDFKPKDGETNLELADVCDGLYRSDEQDSCAEEAYDNAFEEAAGGGFGAWRLKASYEDEYDEDNDRQRVRFEPIYDADTSVYFDIDAKRQTKSDAKECWVLYSMSQEAYVEKFDDDPTTWPKAITSGAFFDWAPPPVVYVAEYYKVEERKVKTHFYMTQEGDELRFTDEEMGEEETLTEIAVKGAVKVKERLVKTRKVRKYLMSGSRILEDQGYVAGRYIPIIPVYGKRWFVDNIERCMGVVRLAKDSQRVDNMVLSVLMMTAASTGIEKPLLTPEQVAGHTDMWAADNITNYPYLLVNPMVGPDGVPVPVGPIAYSKPPSIPPALVALLQVADQSLGEILGRPQDAEGLVSNISADAVEMIQGRLDLQAYIYLSNFAKAMQWCGEVWLSVAKALYVEEGRKMKSIGEMGNVESVELGKPVIDEKTGEVRYSNDLTQADFDVTSDVGPSFNSKREATVRALSGLLGDVADPVDRKILQSMILMNMDGEGLTEVREYFRKQLVSMGVIPPNEEEREEMEAAKQQQQPDANTTFLLAESEKSLSVAKLNEAKAQETEANMAQVLAKAELMAAQIEEIMARIPKLEAETNAIEREPVGVV